MLAVSVQIEDCAWIRGKIGERKTARGVILGGSVAHDTVKTLSTDEREIARPGLRTPLGAAGDMDSPGEAKPGQQSGKPAPVTTCVERGRRTAASARASFDPKQGIAGINNQAVVSRSVENTLS